VRRPDHRLGRLRDGQPVLRKRESRLRLRFRRRDGHVHRQPRRMEQGLRPSPVRRRRLERDRQLFRPELGCGRLRAEDAHDDHHRNVFRRCGKDSRLLAEGERSCQVRLEECSGLTFVSKCAPRAATTAARAITPRTSGSSCGSSVTRHFVQHALPGLYEGDDGGSRRPRRRTTCSRTTWLPDDMSTTLPA